MLQIQKQQEDLAMLLATNKQQHKEKTQNRKTQQNRLNAQKKDSGQKHRPSGLTRLQNHLEYSKCWNSKKGFFFIEQPSSPL
jgi:hypothetical protein